jgi:hypothetical protein
MTTNSNGTPSAQQGKRGGQSIYYSHVYGSNATVSYLLFDDKSSKTMEQVGSDAIRTSCLMTKAPRQWSRLDLQ